MKLRNQNTALLLIDLQEGFTKPTNNEPLLIKEVNSSFIGTDLEQQLNNIHKLVIVGLTTNHCISTTTRMAGSLGLDTIIFADATATFDRIEINKKVFPA